MSTFLPPKYVQFRRIMWFYCVILCALVHSWFIGIYMLCTFDYFLMFGELQKMSFTNPSSNSIEQIVIRISQLSVASTILQFTISVRPPEVLWKVTKFGNGTKKSLAVHLRCVNEDTSLDWTTTAWASIKLLPFNDDQRSIEDHLKVHRNTIFLSSIGRDFWSK